MEISLESLVLEEKATKISPVKLASSNSSVWPTVKPFLNGGLAGVWPTAKPFLNGGFAGALAVSPVYLLVFGARHALIRQAKSYGSPELLDQMREVLYYPGGPLHGFFKGFPAGLLLEATCTTARFGLFELLTKKVEAANGGRSLTMYQEACCGLTAGAIGAFVSSPIQLAWTLIKNDASLPAAQQLNYRNVFHALSRTVADKGVLAMWKGAGPFINTQMALNMGMMASYNRSFNYFKEFVGLNEYRTRLCAGAVSGFFASVCSLPVVNVYNLMQLSSGVVLSNGKAPFTSSLDCALKVMQYVPSAFYWGFFQYFARITPFIMLTWLVFEEVLDIKESMGL